MALRGALGRWDHVTGQRLLSGRSTRPGGLSYQQQVLSWARPDNTTSPLMDSGSAMPQGHGSTTPRPCLCPGAVPEQDPPPPLVGSSLLGPSVCEMQSLAASCIQSSW